MAKYHIHKVKNLKFARFGGLSSVNQLGYSSKMPDFHSPPASRGFYCFVWPFYEIFLLGASQTKDPYVTGAKFSYVRDGKGNIIDDKHSEYTRLSEMNDNLSKYWSVESKAWKDFKRKNDWPDYPKDGDDEFYDTKTEELYAKWDAEFSHLPKWVLVQKPHPRIFEHSGEIWSHLGTHLKPHQVLAVKGNWAKSSVEDYRDALEKEMHSAKKISMKYLTDSTSEYKNLYIPSKSAFRISSKDHLECFVEKL